MEGLPHNAWNIHPTGMCLSAPPPPCLVAPESVLLRRLLVVRRCALTSFARPQHSKPMRTLMETPTPNYDVNVTPVPAAVSKRQLLLSVLPSFFVLLYPLVGGATGAFSAPQAAFLFAWPWIGMSLIFTCMTQARAQLLDAQS
mgnify:CR=1 FL=1